MATAKEVILGQLQMGQSLIEMMTKDLSDAEYFMMPAKGANHAGWILGHIACSEDNTVAQLTGAAKRIEDATHAMFDGGSTCEPDASKYPARKKIDEMFLDTRAVTVEALKMFDESRWGDASPESYPKAFFPTVGSVWGVQGAHPFWHIGQLTVCRAAMNKPRVLG